MKKILLALLLVLSAAVGYAQPGAPSSGRWVIVDTSYQVGTQTLGVTKSKLYYANTTTTKISGLQFRVFYDKVAFGVLQEYARSGLFNKIVLLDKLKLENIIGNLSILDYEDKITSLIASTIHMINVYDNINPVLTNSAEKSEVCRINSAHFAFLC